MGLNSMISADSDIAFTLHKRNVAVIVSKTRYNVVSSTPRKLSVDAA